MPAWSQKADADTGKNMGGRPAGSAVEHCPDTLRQIESLFVPPEVVDVVHKVEAAAESVVETVHSILPDLGL